MKQAFIYIGIIIIAALRCDAQTDSLDKAIHYLQQDRLEMAQIAIDAASKDVVSSKVPNTWYYRGWIYKALMKKAVVGEEALSLREISFQAFKKSIDLDTSKQYLTDNRNNIKFLASKYNNEASANLTPENYEKAINAYKKFIEYMTIADSTLNIPKKTIEFNNALASLFTRTYEAQRKEKTDLLPRIETLYKEVLSFDSVNYTANYNLGLHYYNQAVHIINELDFDIDLIALNEIEDKTIALFKQSLPFAEKAHRLYPSRKETIIALQGIYFSLNDLDKSNQMKELLEKIEKGN